ncbi:lipoprotein LpqH [Tsukamurella sp. 1534]|uniref:lipoprotein LpqH n=1 Tax=Tsukamurella sp. 1534 TaxID=1151061 RepID=UPI0002F42E73|nr:lipoprotein LpqH [Tsukamurella sp. 1534]
MNRTLPVLAVAAIAVLGLTACGGGGSDSGSGSSGDGGDAKTTVKVDGKDLEGVNLDSVGCTKQENTVLIGSAGASGGVGATLSAGDPPSVQTVGITVDGNALAVGPGVGEATVKVEGSRYIISGTAQGGNIANPMAGIVKKQFEIAVTCR